MSLLADIAAFALSRNASDIHVSPDNPPAVRIDGQIAKLSGHEMTREEIERIAKECAGDEGYKEFLATGDYDGAFELPGVSRFRVNLFRQRNGTSIAMRIIRKDIPDLNALGLSPLLDRLLTLKEGLVLVTGPTGSGKSTTLAAIIHELNKTRKSHIITIEDPIEYIHTPLQAVVNQRETGKDSRSYATALRAALREDPDIILVGEMRDLESISITMTAAETGHLVFSTLHTSGAAKSLDRLIDVVPPSPQQQMRIQTSLSLRAVISQCLVQKTGGGRTGAFEVMYVNNAISNLIRENNTSGINNVIQTSLKDGMTTMERSVTELFEKGIITKETAAASCPSFLQRVASRL